MHFWKSGIYELHIRSNLLRSQSNPPSGVTRGIYFSNHRGKTNLPFQRCFYNAQRVSSHLGGINSPFSYRISLKIHHLDSLSWDSQHSASVLSLFSPTQHWSTEELQPMLRRRNKKDKSRMVTSHGSFDIKSIGFNFLREAHGWGLQRSNNSDNNRNHLKIVNGQSCHLTSHSRRWVFRIIRCGSLYRVPFIWSTLHLRCAVQKCVQQAVNMRYFKCCSLTNSYLHWYTSKSPYCTSYNISGRTPCQLT